MLDCNNYSVRVIGHSRKNMDFFEIYNSRIVNLKTDKVEIAQPTNLPAILVTKTKVTNAIGETSMTRQEVYQLSPYLKEEEKPDDNEKMPIYLGDLHSKTKYQNAEPTDYIEVPYTIGSDYSGNSVEVSNYRAIWNDHKEMPGLYQIYGGFGTYGLVIRRDVLESDTEHGKTMREIIEKLNDYPLHDEEVHSEVEMEAQTEAWKSWAAHDYRRLLEKQELLATDAHTPAPYTNDVSDDQLFQVFWQVADAIGEYWENETGNSAHINVECVAENTTAEDVVEVLSEVVTNK